MNDSPEYNVTCAGCRTRFDAMTANWCGCLLGHLSLACPKCQRCFCRAPEALRNSFWLTAPAALVRRRSDEQNRRLEQSSAIAQTNHRRVMVVDDDPELRELLYDFLTKCGFEVMTASDADEALSVLNEWRPHIVITDALMPRMDGRELCRQIKTVDRSVKVVVVTSLYTGIRYKMEAMRTFLADEYMPKPIDFARLYEILAAFSSREGKSRRPNAGVATGMAV